MRADQEQIAAGLAPERSKAADRWPRQIKYIVGNEACERFSYYGMRALLVLYLTAQIVNGGFQLDRTSTRFVRRGPVWLSGQQLFA